MDGILAWIDPHLGTADLLAALAITLGAGVVKGLVGFAMPMLMISGLTLFLAPDIALAALILPTLISNLMQAFRGGFRGAWAMVMEFRFYIFVMLTMLFVATQAVPGLSPRVFFLGLGVPITAFTLMNIALPSWRLARRSRLVETVIGAIAGLAGGISGVWGPPTVAYLTALDVPKAKSVRVQGMIYLTGSVALMAGHSATGVFGRDTIGLSIWMVAPAILGVVLGQKLQDRIDQKVFRRVTLIVLLLAGLNLLRRGLF